MQAAGGGDNMQAHEPHIEDSQPSAIPVSGRYTEELEDAISQYLPLLYRRAYRFVGDPHDAEDAVQDALLSAYKHLGQFKGNAKMTTWLTSIVTNSALTKLRKKPRQPHFSLDEGVADEEGHFLSDTLADSRPDPERECIESEMRRNLMQSVMQLSPILRETVQMHDLEGLQTREVASILGVPDGTVKARVSRARSKLKQQLRRRTQAPVALRTSEAR
jgi:RNA polymerase sigma-70 factor (ECF subfamily)